MRLFSLMLGILFLLAGCSSPAPKPTGYPLTFQQKMQAAEHWDILAKSVADEVSRCVSKKKECRIGIGQGIYVEPKPGVFGRAFTNMLISHLARPEPTRDGCIVLKSEKKGCLVLKFEVQVISLGILTDIFAGPPKAMHPKEVHITTSIVKDNQYVYGKSDIYYINDPDAWNYITTLGDPAEKPSLVTFQVKGEGCEEAEKDCIPDSDGDGVPDNIDQCPETPLGVKVDGTGCPLDSDGDGVPDYLDKCPGTPPGVQVDDRGCPEEDLDTDGDGVSNTKDKCPGTPKGATVDSRGCWVIDDTLFDFDKYTIKPKYYHVIDNVVTVLKRNPSLKISIHGYTDHRGTDIYNQVLSENRARSVRNYLVKKGINKNRLSSMGHGEAKPKAFTEAGMAFNRRVELTPIH